MPIVARGDKDRVDVFTVEQFVHIDVGLAIGVAVGLIDGCLGFLALFLETIADRHDLRVLLRHERAHDVLAAAAAPNHAHGDSLARRGRAIGAKHCRRNDRRRRENGTRGGGALDELATAPALVHMSIHYALLF